MRIIIDPASDGNFLVNINGTLIAAIGTAGLFEALARTGIVPPEGKPEPAVKTCGPEEAAPDLQPGPVHVKQASSEQWAVTDGELASLAAACRRAAAKIQGLQTIEQLIESRRVDLRERLEVAFKERAYAFEQLQAYLTR